MGKRNKQQQRAKRKGRKRHRKQVRLSRLKEIVRMCQEYPDIDNFIDSLDTSGFRRLLGIFRCPPEQYLQTEAVLERHGYSGYQMLQAEIETKDGSAGDGQGRGWTAAVKKEAEADEQFKIVVAIVQPEMTGDSSEDDTRRWAEVVSVVHELGHAHDMDRGISFQLGQPFNIEEAELFAHNFACQVLRKREMIMGLTAYLSIAICPISQDEGSAAEAAKRFMASEEYGLCIKAIPRHIRESFDIPEV